jgi:hypothetical protein
VPIVVGDVACSGAAPPLRTYPRETPRAPRGMHVAVCRRMKVPFNMTTPRLKLADGEEVIHVEEGMRKKGIFGSRFGELVVTNRRVAFVKSIMKAGLISAAANALGAKPIVSFDRTAITGMQKVPHKKLVALVVSDAAKSERFLIEPDAIDRVLAIAQA